MTTDSIVERLRALYTKYMTSSSSSSPDLGIPDQAADLAISISHSGNFNQGQTGATLSIVITNRGNADSTGLTTVTIALPTGLTYSSMAGTGWTIDAVNKTATRTDKLYPTLAYPTITLTVDVSQTAAAMLTVLVRVSGSDDYNLTNNQAIDVIAVNVPDMTLTMTHTGNALPGQEDFSYTITATNVGGATTFGTVSVTVTLPAALTLASLSGTGWTVASNVASRSDALAAGASYPALTLLVDVSASAPELVVPLATVSGGGDSVSSNNQVIDPTAVTTSGASVPDLAVALSHSGNFYQGDSGDVSVIVVNVGGASTSGTVTAYVYVSSGLSITTASGTGWTWNSTPKTATRSDALGAGNTYPQLTVTVAASDICNSPQWVKIIVAGGGQYNTLNDTAFDYVGVLPYQYYATVDRSTDQTIGDSTWTTMSWDNNQVLHGSGIRSGIPGDEPKLITPVAALYQFEARISWDSNATGVRLIAIFKNAGSQIAVGAVNTVNGYDTVQELLVQVDAAADDYFYVKVYQSSGGNLAVNKDMWWSCFSMRRVSW